MKPVSGIAQGQRMVRLAVWNSQQRCVKSLGAEGRLTASPKSLLRVRFLGFKEVCNLCIPFAGSVDLANSFHLFVSSFGMWGFNGVLSMRLFKVGPGI